MSTKKRSHLNIQECKDRLDNLAARAIAANFVTHRSVQMHYDAAFQFSMSQYAQTNQ